MDVTEWITITLMVDILALTFQVAAYISPLWLWIQDGSTYFGMGLWYTVGCTGPTCTQSQSSVNMNDLQNTNVPFLFVRILQSMGMVGILIITILLVVLKVGFRHKYNTMRSINTAAFVVCIITLFLLLASAILFPAFFSTFFTLSETYNSVSLPWSPIMSLIATLILIIVCVFIRVKCRPKAYNGQEFPMSGDPKVEVHPQMQNGNVSRYFNPTPYMDDRGTYTDDRGRFIDDYGPVHDNRMHDYLSGSRYSNRGYRHEKEPTVIYYGKTTSSQFRDNRDRELGHTVYNGREFSQLERETGRTGRQVALPYYGREDYYDPYSREQMAPSGRSRVLPEVPPSNAYNMYRPQRY